MSACTNRTPRTSSGDASVDVVVETPLGIIELAIEVARAPASSLAFLALVDDGSFTRSGGFYRSVRAADNDHGHPKIDVVQGGLLSLPGSLPLVEHESTESSGLRHLNGTLSLARGSVGSATGATFFICVGVQRCLDFGGQRDLHGDGQGFAAFGIVSQGMATVRLIHQQRTSQNADNPYVRGQILQSPVRILRAVRGRAVHASP